MPPVNDVAGAVGSEQLGQIRGLRTAEAVGGANREGLDTRITPNTAITARIIVHAPTFKLCAVNCGSFDRFGGSVAGLAAGGVRGIGGDCAAGIGVGCVGGSTLPGNTFGSILFGKAE